MVLFIFYEGVIFRARHNLACSCKLHNMMSKANGRLEEEPSRNSGQLIAH